MPYNNPIKKKGSVCKQLKTEKGKPSGLMMEGSVAHQESAAQEKKNLLKDMPIDNRGVAQMSPLNDNHPGIDPKTGGRVDEFGTSIPEGFESSMGENYDENAASKKFFRSQNIVNRAVQTLEDIEGGKTPYTGFANAASTVKRALLGSENKKGGLTTSQLKSLAKTDPVKGMEYLSQNIRNAPLGDAKRLFDESYNPFTQS